MGWVVLSLRRNELQASIQQLQSEVLQLSKEYRELSKFSSAIGDGVIDPSEIGSMSSSLFNYVLGFSNDSAEYAASYAEEISNEYVSAYSNVTEQQYYNNSSLSSKATLYFTEDGDLDVESIYDELYNEGLKDFAQNGVAQELNELEDAIQQEKTEKEALLEQEEAELDSVKQSISEQISNSTIKL